jgi:hypothetical protein
VSGGFFIGGIKHETQGKEKDEMGSPLNPGLEITETRRVEVKERGKNSDNRDEGTGFSG